METPAQYYLKYIQLLQGQSALAATEIGSRDMEQLLVQLRREVGEKERAVKPGLFWYKDPVLNAQIFAVTAIVQFLLAVALFLLLGAVLIHAR